MRKIVLVGKKSIYRLTPLVLLIFQLENSKIAKQIGRTAEAIVVCTTNSLKDFRLRSLAIRALKISRTPLGDCRLMWLGCHGKQLEDFSLLT